jgi:hypothetical protein
MQKCKNSKLGKKIRKHSIELIIILFFFFRFFKLLKTGPTFATTKVLKSLNLTLQDIGVIEFHEAFAGILTIFKFILFFI